MENLIALLCFYSQDLREQPQENIEIFRDLSQGGVKYIESIPQGSVNQRFIADNTYLNCATEYNNLRATKLLLELGADPNVITGNLTCPLSNAVGNNNRQMVDLLLEHGANINYLFYYINELYNYEHPGLMELFLRSCSCGQLLSLQRRYPYIDQTDEYIQQIKGDIMGYINKQNIDSEPIWGMIAEYL